MWGSYQDIGMGCIVNPLNCKWLLSICLLWLLINMTGLSIVVGCLGFLMDGVVRHYMQGSGAGSLLLCDSRT